MYVSVIEFSSCGEGQVTQIEKMGNCQNLSPNISKCVRDRNKNEHRNEFPRKYSPDYIRYM